MLHNQLDILLALVEDAESGSDTVALDLLTSRLMTLNRLLRATLLQAGNECTSYEARRAVIRGH